jgi:hypothetical protein
MEELISFDFIWKNLAGSYICREWIIQLPVEVVVWLHKLLGLEKMPLLISFLVSSPKKSVVGPYSKSCNPYMERD